MEIKSRPRFVSGRFLDTRRLFEDLAIKTFGRRGARAPSNGNQGAGETMQRRRKHARCVIVLASMRLGERPACSFLFIPERFTKPWQALASSRNSQ